MSHDSGPGARLPGADDFTRITGIGTKIAQRLHAAGIRTYAALAARSVDDITRLLADITGVSAARVAGWRDRAAELAAAAATAPPAAEDGTRGTPSTPGPPAPETAADAESVPHDGQHYESFLIRVLLNSEDGSVRRTTARHIRTDEERHWPGLDHQALSSFIEAALDTATRVTGPPAEPHSVPVPRDAATPGPAPAAALSGPRSTAVLLLDRATLRAAEPFTMTMRIEFATAVEADRLAYSAVVVARPVHGGPKRTIAQAAGLLATTAPVISIDATGLPAGLYRLDGAVSLHPHSGAAATELAGLVEGMLVHVLPG